MSYRRRIYITREQRSEIWDRWQRGESMSSIGRGFERDSSSIYPLLSRTGGIRPPDRKRSGLSLTLVEREEISRGLEGRLSLRCIARRLQRAASTISREVKRNGGADHYRAVHRPPGIAPFAPGFASWLATDPCAEQYPGSFSCTGRPSRLQAGSSVHIPTMRLTTCPMRRSIEACLFRHAVC